MNNKIDISLLCAAHSCIFQFVLRLNALQHTHTKIHPIGYVQKISWVHLSYLNTPKNEGLIFKPSYLTKRLLINLRHPID